MRRIFVDTETTDLNPGQICQLTYLIEDESKRLIKRFNQFYTVDKVEPGASKVNGLTADKLKIISDGAVFESRALEVYNDFMGSTFIAHNAAFDEKFVSTELYRCGYSYLMDNFICTAEYFKPIMGLKRSNGKPKHPNMKELMAFLQIDDNMVIQYTQSIFGNFDVAYHDARYDTVALYLCVKRAEMNNMM